MVIKPLNDPTSCAQFVVADLRPLDFGVRGGRGRAHSIASPWVPISSLSTHTVYLQSFLSETRMRFRLMLDIRLRRHEIIFFGNISETNRASNFKI